MKKKLALVVALIFYASLLPWYVHSEPYKHQLGQGTTVRGTDNVDYQFGAAFDGSYSLTPKVADLIVKSSPWVDVRAYVPPGTAVSAVTDWSPYIQAAIDSFGVPATNSGTVFLPPIKMDFATKLVFKGTSANSVNLIGIKSAEGASKGSLLNYTGTTGGTGIEVKGGHKQLFADFAVSSQSELMKYGITIEYDQDRSQGNAGMTFRNVIVQVAGNGGIGVTIGKNNLDVSHTTFYDCHITGNDVDRTIAVYGGQGNAKQVTFFGGYLMYADIGYSSIGSTGQVTFNGTGFYGNDNTDVYAMAGDYVLIGVNSESSARFIDSTLGGTSANTLTIMGSSWVGSIPTSGYGITYGGALTLINNRLMNQNSAAGYFFRVKAGSAQGVNSDIKAITSIGNAYSNANKANTPWFDGSGNRLWEYKVEDYGAYTPSPVTSINDRGEGVDDVLIRPLDTGTRGEWHIGPNRFTHHYYDVPPAAGDPAGMFRTWHQGDHIFKTKPAPGVLPGWVVTTEGTISTATDNAGDTTSGSPTITGMATVSGFNFGDYVTVSAGLPSASYKYRIITIGTDNITLDTNATSSQSNVTVATPNPVFTDMQPLKVTAPSTNTTACTTNSFAHDTTYWYWCYSTNNWRRVAYDGAW